MAISIDLGEIIAKSNVRPEDELEVKAYLEKVFNDLGFNVDAYELQMICVAYSDGLNARQNREKIGK